MFGHHLPDLEGLKKLRSRLRSDVISSPLFDAERFGNFFEEALKGMWEEKSNHDKRKYKLMKKLNKKAFIRSTQPKKGSEE